MTGKLEQSWRVVGEHLRPLLALVFAVYMPYYLVYVVVVGLGWLPQDAGDKLFGLIGVLVMPVVNAGVVFLTHRWLTGGETTFAAVRQAVQRSWSRLLTAYVSVSFILLGWLAVTVLPAYALLMILKVQEPLWLTPIAVVAVAAALSRYAFLDPLVVLEELGPWQARQRSAELAKGRRLRIVGWGLLTMGPPFALETGGELLGDYLGAGAGHLPLAIEAVTGLAAAVLYVLPVVFFYLYYRELAAPEAAAGQAQVLEFPQPINPL